MRVTLCDSNVDWMVLLQRFMFPHLVGCVVLLSILKCDWIRRHSLLAQLCVEQSYWSSVDLLVESMPGFASNICRIFACFACLK